MLNALQAVGGFVLIFGVVVFVHELGHFLAAKWAGVYAPKFSIGFGPGPSRRFGETQYILGVIPLGGYVRMASREDEAAALLEGGSEEAAAVAAEDPAKRPKDWNPNAMIPFGPLPVPEDRWFESKPLSKRLVIMFAGVTMNALLALSIYIGFASHYGRTTIPTRVVGGVHDVPAAEGLPSRLAIGDTILAIQGKPMRNWNDIVDAVLSAPGATLELTTQHGAVTINGGTANGPRRQMLTLALEHYVAPVIGAVLDGKPAAVAGLAAGDSIVAIGGKPVRSFYELIMLVSAAPGTPLDFEVSRAGARLQMTIRPESTDVVDPLTNVKQMVGRIGAAPAPEPTTHEPLDFPQAVVEGAKTTWTMAGTIFGTLRSLIVRETSVDQLGGPILIAQQAASAAHEGIASILRLLALLSINLAVLNLLPIPVLDGGQILLQVAEAVKGRPFSQRTRSYILGTGIAVVLLLMLVVSYNDILRLVR